jgi:hypothetical protein
MILYLSGNFPQLSNIKKERIFIERLKKKGETYNRLISFYYREESETVLKLMEEINNPKERETHLVEKPKMSKSLKTRTFI